MLVVCLYHTGENCPFSIIRCSGIKETGDKKVSITIDFEEEIFISDYDYYKVYKLDTDNEIETVVKLFQNFVKVLEGN